MCHFEQNGPYSPMVEGVLLTRLLTVLHTPRLSTLSKNDEERRQKPMGAKRETDVDKTVRR